MKTGSDNNEDPEAPPIKEQIPLENQLETLESQLREVNANYEQLKSNFLELTQLRHVLNKTQVWFDEAQNFAENAPGVERDPETGEAERIRLLNRAIGYTTDKVFSKPNTPSIVYPRFHQ